MLYICDGFIAGAEVVLGNVYRRQPDWFKDSAATLQPLICSRNDLSKRWLQTHCCRDRQHYIAMRRTATNSVRKEKNDWFRQKAREIEDKVMRGVGAWKGIRDIQRVRATRPKAIRDLNCQFCATPADSLQRWKQHFSTVLNTFSVFSEEVINIFPSYNIRGKLGCVLTLQEVKETLSMIELVVVVESFWK